MGVTRTPTAGIPLIKGSMKTIVVELYKNLHHIKEVPTDSPALAKAILLDMQTAESGRKILFSTNRLNATSEDTRVSIDKVRNEFKTELTNKFENIKPQVKQINMERENLKNEYTKLVEDQQQTIYSLFREKKPPDEILREITKLDSKYQQYVDKVNKHFKTYYTLLDDLDQIHKDAYNIATDKKGLPLPEQEKVAIAKRRPI